MRRDAQRTQASRRRRWSPVLQALATATQQQAGPFCRGPPSDSGVVSEVTQRLYLSDEEPACDQAVLWSLGITHIVRVEPDEGLPLFEGIRYLRLPSEDLPDYPIAAHFAEATRFIAEAMAGSWEHRVLVHCQAGISRSPTIVAAYLMGTGNLSADAALSETRRRHPPSLPNEGFRRQLDLYEDALDSRRRCLDQLGQRIADASVLSTVGLYLGPIELPT